MNSRVVLLAASATFAVVGASLVLAAVAVLAGDAWAVLLGGTLAVYAAYVLSTYAERGRS